MFATDCCFRVDGERVWWDCIGMKQNKAFTLIEILVVVSIIGILIGLLFPAIKGAIHKAKCAKAKTECESIVQAVNAYYTEYGKLPVANSAQGGTDETAYPNGGWCDATQSKAVINVLLGNDAAVNPRRIAFIGVLNHANDGTMLDPWKRQYLIKLDTNYDNRIEYFNAPGAYATKVIAICLGKNGGPPSNPATGDDIIDFQ